MDYGTRGCMVVVGGACVAFRYGKLGCPPTWERAYGNFLDNSRRGYRLPSSKGSLSRFLPKRQKVWITPNSPHVFVPACLYKGAHDVVGQVSGSRSLDNDISSVAYAVSVTPLLLCAPARFCSAIVEVIRDCSSDETCVEGFEWSLGFLTRTFVRTIAGAPIIVLDAITTNGRSQCS